MYIRRSDASTFPKTQEATLANASQPARRLSCPLYNSLTVGGLRVPTPLVLLQVLRVAKLFRARLALILLNARMPGHVTSERGRRGKALTADLTVVPVLTVIDLHVRCQ